MRGSKANRRRLARAVERASGQALKASGHRGMVEALEARTLLANTITLTNDVDVSYSTAKQWYRSDIVVTGAPTGATVTSVDYSWKVDSNMASDIWEQLTGPGYTGTIYKDMQKTGGDIFSGYSDTSEGAKMVFPAAGTAVNGTWSFGVYDSYQDYSDGLNSGRIDSWTITIHYTQPAAPEIQVFGGSYEIANGDTTPSALDGTDFGSYAVGQTSPTRSFTIKNSGTGTLTLGAVTVPSGFSIVQALPASLAANGSATLILKLDTTTAGTYTGNVSIVNNDADGGDGVENPFTFKVTGTVASSNSGTVSGMVYEDEDADGVLGTAYQPLDGNVVYADLNGNGVLDTGEPSARTSIANGLTYKLSLAPGTYTIRTQVPTGWHQSAPASGTYSVTIASGLISLGYDFGIYTTGSVSVRVFDDSDGDGTCGGSEVGIAGRSVYADLNNNGMPDGQDPVAVTNASGIAQLNLLPGTYAIRQVIPSGWTQTKPAGGNALSVTIRSGLGTLPQDMGTQCTTGCVSVTVFDDVDGNGVRDQGEGWQTGRTVYIDTNVNGAYDSGEPSAITDASGFATITAVPPGTCSVRLIPVANRVMTCPRSGSMTVDVSVGWSSFADSMADTSARTPWVLVTKPVGWQSGDIAINYMLTDPDSDPCSIVVEYSTDGGNTWKIATAGAGGDGTADLASTPFGVAHMFVWASGSDLIAPNLSSVIIRITPSDSSTGLSATTGAFFVYNYVNSAPTATVSLSTPAPKTADVIIATATKSDAEGDPVSLTFVWKVNGVVKRTFSSAIALTDSFDLGVAGNGSKGDTVSVQVTPNDGTVDGLTVSDSAVVGNTAPIATVSLNTRSPRTTDVLIATATKIEADSDVVSLTFVWKVDGVIKRTFTSATALTDSFDLNAAGNGNKGQSVTVEVTANDGTVDSAVVSAAATIANTSPFATVSLNTSSPKTADILTATATKADVDGDTVGLTFVWKVNGVIKRTFASTTALTDSFDLGVAGQGDKSQTVTVEITPNDGAMDGPTASVIATVANSAPAATVILSPSSPKTRDVLTATASKLDADSDSVNLTFVWKVNGALKRTFTSATALTDSLDLSLVGNGDKGQTVTVEVTPNDGTVYGLMVSDVAVVANTAPVVGQIARSVILGNTLSFAAGDFTAAGVFSDVDGDLLQTLRITALPQHGLLMLNGVEVAAGQSIGVSQLGGLTYTPKGYVGGDSFGWTAFDGTAEAIPTVVNLTITNAASGLAVISSKASSTYGEQVTFTARVGSAVGVPTGNVQFYVDGKAVGSPVTVGADGAAVYSTASLLVGSHSIAASYGGDPLYLPCSGSVGQVVAKAPLSVVVDDKAITYGQTLPELTGQIRGVVMGDGITVSYSALVDSQRNAGSYAIIATIADPNGRIGNYDVTNQAAVLTISKADPVISWSTPADITYGTRLSTSQLNATVAGMVGGSAPGALSYDQTVGTLLNGGAGQMLTVHVAGTINYNPATLSVPITVNKARQTITWVTPARIAAGMALDNKQLDASVRGLSGGSAPGALSYEPAAGTVMESGSYVLTVTAAATQNYEQASASVTLLVDYSPTAVKISNASVAENQDPGTEVGVLRTEDPDDLQGFSYAIVSVDGQSGSNLFRLEGSVLKTNADFDHEAQASHVVRIRSTDVFQQSFEQDLTITIGDVVEDVTVNGTDGDDQIQAEMVNGMLRLWTDGAYIEHDPSMVHTLTIDGGAGNDTITLGEGVPAALVQGGEGDDQIITTANGARDTVEGGAGRDYLHTKAIDQVRQDAADLLGRFGMTGPKATKLVLSDVDGDQISFSLSGGGMGRVYGPGMEQIVLTGTTSQSVLSITVRRGRSGDGVVQVGRIMADGQLKSFSAPGLFVTGDVVLNQQDQSGSSLNSLSLGGIHNGWLSAGQEPIKSLTLLDWQQDDGVGTLTAPWVGSISVKGRVATKTLPALSGDLDVALVLGQTVAGVSLTSLSVKGAWTGDLHASGSVGKVMAGAISGDLTAAYFGSVTTRINATSSTANGNLSGQIHATGKNAKGVALGTLSVAGNAGGMQRASVVAESGSIGTVKVAGKLEGSKVQAATGIGSVTVGSLLGSDILVGVAADLPGRFASTAAAFANPSAKLGSLMVKGGLSATTAYTADSQISAGVVGTVKLTNFDAGRGQTQIHTISASSVSYTDKSNRQNNWVWTATRPAAGGDAVVDIVS